MPFKSEAQRRLFYAKAARGEIPMSTVKRWERETKKRRRKNPEYYGPGYTSHLEDYAKKSDAELLYIMRDASRAARAAQEIGDEAAERKYLDQLNDASTIMHRRRKGTRSNPTNTTLVDDVVEGMARAFYATAWADGVEKRGGSLSGVEIMDVLPEPIPDVAWHEARALTRALGGRRELARYLTWAARADGDPSLAVDDEDYAQTFGHYLAMMAMGHGVSWFDDHKRFPLNVPHVEGLMPDDLPEDVFDDV